MTEIFFCGTPAAYGILFSLFFITTAAIWLFARLRERGVSQEMWRRLRAWRGCSWRR